MLDLAAIDYTARRLSAAHYNSQLPTDSSHRLTAEHMKVVIFNELTDGWTAFVKTDQHESLMYEVHYIRSRKQTDIHLYSKITTSSVMAYES